MSFSYSATWDDTTRLLRTNASLLSAIAGAFIFLPMLLVAYFLPEPAVEGKGAMQALVNYYTANLLWLLLERLVQMIGSAATFVLLSAKGRHTVQGAIGTAIGILPVYFVTVLLANLAIGAGFALFLIPGLYLLGRLSLSGIVVADGGYRNPIGALKKSFDITKGRGWAVAGLILAVAVAGFICIAATMSVFGAIVLLAGLGDLGKFFLTIFSTVIMTLLYVVLIVLLFAIYRRLSDAGSARY